MALHWHLLSLPVGLKVAIVKESTAQLALAGPEFGEKGLTLSFIHYKGELFVRPASRPGEEGPIGQSGNGAFVG